MKRKGKNLKNSGIAKVSSHHLKPQKTDFSQSPCSFVVATT
jgi:hypothetical protein